MAGILACVIRVSPHMLGVKTTQPVVSEGAVDQLRAVWPHPPCLAHHARRHTIPRRDLTLHALQPGW